MKPILFNTEMVRAILEGRKTVTRRVAKMPSHILLQDNGLYTLHTEGTCYENQSIEDIIAYLRPPYQTGDILYVRETWYRGLNRILYKANYGDNEKFYQDGKEILIKWKPSIHMPKEAARLFLRVTSVRLERLQDITEEQAEAEGIRSYTKDGKLYKYAASIDWWSVFHYKNRKMFRGNWWQDMPRTATEAFHYLWNSTLGRKNTPEWYANNWSNNPYVWVIEFENISEDIKDGRV